MLHTDVVRKLMIFLLMLAAVLVGAELVADRLAESMISDKAKSRTGARRAETSIDSFPLMIRLLATRQVEQVNVRLERVRAGPLEIDRLTADLHDVRVSLGDLPEGLSAVKKIDRGVLTATITRPAIESAAGVPLPDGGPEIEAALDDGTLSLSASGLPEIAIPLGVEVLPCSAGAQLTGVRLRLRCTVHEIPTRFLEQT